MVGSTLQVCYRAPFIAKRVQVQLSKYDREKAAWIKKTAKTSQNTLYIICDTPKSSHATKTALNLKNRMGEINPYSGSAAQIFRD